MKPHGKGSGRESSGFERQRLFHSDSAAGKQIRGPLKQSLSPAVRSEVLRSRFWLREADSVQGGRLEAREDRISPERIL